MIMTKEELIEFLKENLKITVSEDYPCDNRLITVSLELLGETISSDTFYPD